VDYSKLVDLISIEKWGPLSDQLVSLILTSKNDEKMPSKLANTMLHHAQNGEIKSKSGLTALLEAALLLEPEKTMGTFGELQMPNVAEQIKASMAH